MNLVRLIHRKERLHSVSDVSPKIKASSGFVISVSHSSQPQKQYPKRSVISAQKQSLHAISDVHYPSLHHLLGALASAVQSVVLGEVRIH